MIGIVAALANTAQERGNEMKLSTKLRIWLGAFIIIPMVLFMISVIALLTIRVSTMSTRYNATGTTYEAIFNPLDMMNRIVSSVYEKIDTLSESTPDTLTKSETLNEINELLSHRYAFLMVELDGKLIYTGEPGRENIFESLSKISYDGDTNVSLVIDDVTGKLLAERVGFVTDNGETGNAYIIMEISEYIPQIKKSLINIVIMLIIILIITSTLIIAWIYKDTVNPINKLQLATHNIMEGNLDFEMETKGSAEIAALCEDFDAMRAKLKENAERQLEDDKENRELISNISHDLKTPITTIKGYAEGLLDGVADTDEKREKYIKTIYNKACDMQQLVEELTFYSRLDNDRMPYNYVPVDIKEYFDEYADGLEDELDGDAIHLEYNNAFDYNTYIAIDTEKFKRVIENVVSNSRKYMQKDDNKIIGISIERGEAGGNAAEAAGNAGSVLIKIYDNGVGFADKDLSHVFDRLYRGDASRNTSMGGSGIGLSIVKKVVTEHGGKVSAGNRPEGGACITIELGIYNNASEVTKDE